MSPSARLVLAGDISPGEHYFTLGHGVVALGAHRGFDYLFDATREWFLRADVGFANLEGVLSKAGLRDGDVESCVFRGVPEMAPALSRAGVRVVSIANNHILQHGLEAYADTLDVLRASGISPCGERGATPFAARPVVVKTGDARVGFLAYSTVPEQFHAGDVPYTRFRLDDAVLDVRELRASVDFVVASVHLGRDCSTRLDAEDVRALQALGSAGADVVAGHHSHVFQRVERRGDSVVCYNLGDFVFDLHWHAPHRQTALVDIRLADAPRCTEVKVVPLYIGRDYAPRPPRNGSQVSTWTGRVFTGVEPEVDVEEPINLRLLPVRKLVFFLRHVLEGRTALKLGFLLKKLRWWARPWRGRR